MNAGQICSDMIVPAAPHIPSCPASPASSASSYHSSQASPALLPQSNNSPIVIPHDMSSLAPPLPPPDDAPNLIRPPSHHSPHPSLSSSMQGQKNEVLRAVGRTSKDGNARDHGPSTARNLASESREHAGMPLDRIPGVEREAVSSKPGSVHSPRRQRRDSQASAQLASPLPHTAVGSRDFLGTPETMNSLFWVSINPRLRIRVAQDRLLLSPTLKQSTFHIHCSKSRLR